MEAWCQGLPCWASNLFGSKWQSYMLHWAGTGSKSAAWNEEGMKWSTCRVLYAYTLTVNSADSVSKLAILGGSNDWHDMGIVYPFLQRLRYTGSGLRVRVSSFYFSILADVSKFTRNFYPFSRGKPSSTRTTQTGKSNTDFFTHGEAVSIFNKLELHLSLNFFYRNN